jgi:hypothetical protein
VIHYIKESDLIRTHPHNQTPPQIQSGLVEKSPLQPPESKAGMQMRTLHRSGKANRKSMFFARCACERVPQVLIKRRAAQMAAWLGHHRRFNADTASLNIRVRVGISKVPVPCLLIGMRGPFQFSEHVLLKHDLFRKHKLNRINACSAWCE